MSVSTELNYVERNWTGVETSFSTGFTAAVATDVVVYSRDGAGVRTLLTKDTHYGVTLSSELLVTITPIALPTAPKTLEISRNTPALQPVVFNDGAFSAKTHENLHDAHVRRAAELKRRVGFVETKALDLDAAVAAAAASAATSTTGASTATTQAGIATTQAGLATAAATAYNQGIMQPETSVASASITDIGAALTERVVVTGTTTITSLGTSAWRNRLVRFTGALTLTHNATSLILPTGSNIVTAAGDTARFVSDASGNWTCVFYQRASGAALSTVGATVAVTDYGVTGGASNEATAFQNAVNAAATLKRPLDLLGLTIRVDSSITLASDSILQNGTINFANAATNDTLFETGGSDGTAQNIGALSENATTIAVTSGAAFAANDYVWISSTDIFGFSAATKGEWQRVRSVVSNTLNLYGTLRDSYSTSVKIYKPTMKRNIKLRDLRLIGGGDSQNAIAMSLRYLTNFFVENCDIEFFGDRCVEVRRALYGLIESNTWRNANEDTGLSYGAALVNGCEAIVVIGNTGEDLRHLVTVGGEDGVDRFITVSGNVGVRLADSGVDCHPNTSHVTMQGNTLDMGHYSTDPDATRNGITAQGAYMNVSNNIIRHFKGIGIHMQALTSVDLETMICEGNTVESDENNVIGIFCDFQKISSASLRGVVISDNAVSLPGTGTRGISCEANASGGTVDGAAITGNSVYARLTALKLFAGTSKVFQDIAVTGNRLRVIATSDPVISLQNTSSGAFLSAITIAGNTIRGGSHGIRADMGAFGADRVIYGENTIQGWATAAVSGTFAGNSNNATT